MLSVLKQFVGKVTGLLNNQFHLTRLRLTAIYAILLLCILVISSTITHSLFSSRLEHRFRVRPPVVPMNDDFRNEAREELVMSLIIVNGVLFVGGVGLSYWLAGITLEPIKAVYDRQRHFLSDASHELRTPLAILQTDLENELAATNLSATARRQTQSHLEEVQRMSALVNDLLLISRLESAETPPHHLATVDLKEAVTTAVARLRSYAHKQQIQLQLQPLPTVPLLVKANPEHVLQALTNVIKNGIEYNQPQGEVKVTLTAANHQSQVTVTDTGIGIPDSEITNIFDRFYRVDQSRSRHFGGSGLGLAIAQSIVQRYGGTLTLTSQEGSGTQVTMTWPIPDSDTTHQNV